MAGTKPAVLIVPGAWHPASAYAPITTALNEAEYDDVTVANLPSLNAKDAGAASCKTDADAVREQILSVVDKAAAAGREVVVLAHSYGGIAAGGGAYGESTTARAKEGKKGGVVGMVYMSAFVVPEGQSLVEYLGGQHPPYLLKDQPGPGLCKVLNSKSVLFNDVLVPAALASSLEASLLPHAIRAFESPAPPPAWAQPDFAGKLAFLRCSLDQALPPFLQDMFVEKSGVEWAVKELECGHSPWASRPVEVVKALEGFLKGFAL